VRERKEMNPMKNSIVPVGHVEFSKTGTIKRINLDGKALKGVDTSNLVPVPPEELPSGFRSLMDEESTDQPVFGKRTETPRKVRPKGQRGIS
jgi:hypothetical protein